MWQRRFPLLGVLFVLLLSLPLRANGESDEEAVPDQPAPAESDLFHPPVRLTAADGVIDSGEAWGHSSPWIVDIDGDGANDLVVGDFSGLFRVHRNEGTNERPRYVKGVNLKAGGVDAKVPIY